MFKVLALGLALAGMGAAQTSSVYQTIYSNVLFANMPTDVVITPQNNIGQNQHMVVLQLSVPASGGTCSVADPARYNIFLQGSIDNVTFINITPIPRWTSTTGVDLAPYQALLVSNGSYPYLRVHYTSVNQGNSGCQISGWYTGSIATISLPLALPAGFTNMLTPVNQDIINGAPAIIGTCAIGRMVVYGIVLSNYGTTASQVTLFNQYFDNTSQFQVMNIGLGVNESLVVPVGSGPIINTIITATPTNASAIQLSVATAGAKVSSNLAYRCEQ